MKSCNQLCFYCWRREKMRAMERERTLLFAIWFLFSVEFYYTTWRKHVGLAFHVVVVITNLLHFIPSRWKRLEQQTRHIVKAFSKLLTRYCCFWLTIAKCMGGPVSLILATNSKWAPFQGAINPHGAILAEEIFVFGINETYENKQKRNGPIASGSDTQ